jgi:nucleotide-binding universal stress UspA family protein
MFTSIVIALDLGATGDRALPIAGSLARLGGLPVELVTVSSPGLSPDRDVQELGRRAAAHGFEQHECVVLHDDVPAAAILDHLRTRPGALLVMGTKAKGPLAEKLLGSVSETVLAYIDRPVLLVGPRAPTGTGLRPTLIACAESHDIDAAAPVIASWVRTFDGGPPSITHVSPTPAKRTGDDAEARALEHVRQLSERLRVLGVIDWSAKVVHGTDVATSLEEVADLVDDAVFVAVSSRWTHAHFHRHSFTRRLVQRSRHPVLVVPAEKVSADQESPSSPQPVSAVIG